MFWVEPRKNPWVVGAAASTGAAFCVALILWVLRLGSAVFSRWADLGTPGNWVLATIVFCASSFALLGFLRLLDGKATQVEGQEHGQGQVPDRACSWTGLRWALGVFLLSAFLYVPFVPDVMSAFWSALEPSSTLSPSVPWSDIGLALGLTAVAWVTVTFVSFAFRLPLVFLRKRQGIRAVYVILLPFVELAQLTFFPFAYFGSLPALFPYGKLSESHVLDSGTRAQDLRLVSIAYDTDWTEEQRSHFSQVGAESGAFARISTGLTEGLLGLSSGQVQRIRVYFPETLFDVSAQQFVALYEQTEEALKASNPALQSVDFFAGVGNSSLNHVVWAGRDEWTRRVKVRSAAAKSMSVPFFEASVFGIQFWQRDEDLSDQWSNVFPLSPSDISALGAPLPQFLICYEGLFPQRRQRDRDLVIFTNHHVFSRFGVLSRAYDEVLMLLSFLTGQRTLLVANAGQSGVVSPRSVDTTSEAIGQVLVVVEPR